MTPLLQGWCETHSCGLWQNLWEPNKVMILPPNFQNQIMFRFQQHQLWMAGSHSCYNTLSVRIANNRCIDPYSVQSGEYLCACVCLSNMQEHMAYRLTLTYRYMCNAYLLNLSLILISWLAVIKKRCTWDDNMSKKNQQVTYESGCPMAFRSFDFLNRTG